MPEIVGGRDLFAELTGAPADACSVAFGCPPVTIWGSTEDSGAAIPATQPDAVTRFLPSTETRFLDADGRIVANDEPGELLLRTPTTTTGYWIGPGQIDPLPEGWFHSGGLMSRHSDGDLRSYGRVAEVVVRNGHGIYSLEIQERIQHQPGVKGAVAVGLADARIGAALVLEAEATPATLTSIMAGVGRDLGVDHVPDRITIVREPKADRKVIADLIAEHGRDI